MTIHPVQELRSLDGMAFTRCMHRLGYARAACYRIDRELMILTVSGGEEANGKPWPSVFALDQFYSTTSQRRDEPLGWLKPKMSPNDARFWPKSIISYFPEQELRLSKFVFVVVPASAKRYNTRCLDGDLEALCQRLSSWSSEHEVRHFVNESITIEHTRNILQKTQNILDHELRNPLAQILGYSYLLTQAHLLNQPKDELVSVIQDSSQNAHRALDKLSLLLKATLDENHNLNKTKTTLNEIIESSSERAYGLFLDQTKTNKSDIVQSRQKIRMGHFEVGEIEVFRPLLEQAITEVLSNALVFGKNGDITISSYVLGNQVVIDVSDNGDGVPSGLEDLIFLQFFRGHNSQKTKRGHRGLGLGLYIARYAAEQHLGQLIYVRRPEKGSLFRFILPILSGTEEKSA